MNKPSKSDQMDASSDSNEKLKELLENHMPCMATCGSQADPADGFGYCTCGAEKDRKFWLKILSSQRREGAREALEEMMFELKASNKQRKSKEGLYAWMGAKLTVRLKELKGDGLYDFRKDPTVWQTNFDNKLREKE